MWRVVFAVVLVLLAVVAVRAWTHGKAASGGSGNILTDPANGDLLTNPANGNLLVKP